MLKTVEYTGQKNIAIVPDETVLKNEIYQKISDMGTTIVTLESYLKYKGSNV